MATISGNNNSNSLTGTGAGDDIYGNGGADTINALDGNDTVFGGTGNDSLLGGGGDDGLFGGDGTDRLFGGDGTDSLYGGTGNDSLDGGAGNDILEGGTGTDTLNGGAGLDTVVYSAETAAVSVNLSTGSATGLSSGTDILSNIENITGSGFNDTLTGNSGANVIDGGAGADTIDAGSGSDTILGGDGNDSIIAGPATPPANTPLDFNWSLAGPDEANIAGGVSQETGGITVDVSFVNNGAATEFSVESSSSIYIAPGETFNPASSLYLYGTGGNQTSTTVIDFSATTGSGFADDVANVRFRLADVDRVNGSWEDIVTIRAYDVDGNLLPVTLTAAGADIVSGNVVTAAEGNNGATEAQGSVLVNVPGPVARIEIDYDNGFTNGQLLQVSDIQFEAIPVDDDVVDAGAGNDVVFGGFGNDSLIGGLGDDTLDGGTGNDTLLGDDGTDVMEGGDGADLIYGGAGNDTISFGSGDDTVYGGDGDDQIDDIPVISLTGNNLIYGGAGNDTVWTGFGADTIYGGDGNDQLFGEADNDLILGDVGFDTLFGGDGNDNLFGGDDADSLLGGAGDDGLSGDAGNDTLLGEAGNDTLLGGAGDDSLSGGADNDSLDGGDGLDTLFGGDGDDTLLGGAGADSLSGDAGNDSLQGDAGNDTLLGGDGNDTLFGGADNDSLLGDAGNDTLDGGDGADTLFGGADSDQLYGGAGNDVLDGGDGPDFIDGGADQDTIFGGIGDTVTGGGTGNDLDVLDLTAWGKAQTNIIFDALNPENGTVQFLDAFGAIIGTMSFTDIETVIPCFTPGSLVATERGDIAVETLCESDLVLTRDNGYQPIRWVGRRDLTVLELFLHETLRPVMIRKGALGPDSPVRDMMVSPQHRMLIEGAPAEMYFGEAEVLVAATHMVGQIGIERAFPKGVSYLHLLFDHHEILCVDGVWTESLQPAQRMLEAMEETDRHEIELLFGDLSEKVVAFPAARRSLKAHEARVLLAA